MLSNVYYLMGECYLAIGDKANACKHFGISLSSHKEALAKNPDAKIRLVEPYKTFEEFIQSKMKEAGCDGQK